MASGPRPWSARSRAGTTPVTPPPAPSRSWPRPRRAALRADRLRGVLRLPGQPPVHPARRGRGARDHLARRSRCFEASAPRAPRDLVLVQGVEPSMRWRTFSADLVDLAEALGVQLVVSLGALLGDVPHTRPVAMTGHASDGALLARLGIASSTYEGPTGIVGVLHAACAEAGLPSASLWAAVPHYVAAASNPKAALALRAPRGRPDRGLGRRVRARVGRGRLRAPGRARGAERPRDPGVRRTARAGRRQRGRGSARRTSPRATSLAREFQRFLRQRGREGAEALDPGGR